MGFPRMFYAAIGSGWRGAFSGPNRLANRLGEPAQLGSFFARYPDADGGPLVWNGLEFEVAAQGHGSFPHIA